jgi:DNA-binding response OmpR family regulator
MPLKLMPQELSRAFTILVVDDEPHLNHLICLSLERMGFTVLTAEDGLAAIDLVQKHEIDLVLLDILIPKMDGYSVCREVRKQSNAPIIMVTALNTTEQIVSALEAGADDYLVKPFVFADLAARIYALLRRVYRVEQKNNSLPWDMEFHIKSHSVTLCSREIPLRPVEFRLLQCLAQSAEKAVSHETLLMEVWGYRPTGKLTIVHTNIRRLRKKIELDPAVPKHIITIPGLGYKFTLNG